MSHPIATNGSRWLYLVQAATAGFAIAGLWAMLALSPRVLYADPWRFATRFLTTSWPWNVLAADNGHRELFPNLVRVIELQWLQGNQWLQIVVGAVLACATVAVLAQGIRRESVQPAARSSALFFAVAGIFWLGNERSLAHGNESVHAYLVTLCLVGGCWLATDASPAGATRRLAISISLGAVAAFSFGSGIACFAAFAIVMLLRKAPWHHVAAILLSGLLTATLHVALGGASAGDAAGMPAGALLLRWLSAPFVYAAWPLLDTQVAAQIPVASLRDACLSAAHGFEAVFGPAMTATWPNALIAICGLGGLFWSTCASWRRPRALRMELVGLGIAWFALVVGVLVCVSRANYFVHHPEQVVAARYLPWSSLFWSGLALSTVLRVSVPASRMVAGALMMAAALLPSQAWMAMLAYRTQLLAESNATAAVVGVLARDEEIGENVPNEIATALPLLRESGKAMFAWPEARALHHPPPSDAVRVAVRNLRFTAVANRLGSPGYRVEFELDDSACQRLLLGDARQVHGMAIREGYSTRWRGWVQQKAEPDPSVLAICR